jgi:hypothetical protein
VSVATLAPAAEAGILARLHTVVSTGADRARLELLYADSTAALGPSAPVTLRVAAALEHARDAGRPADPSALGWLRLLATADAELSTSDSARRAIRLGAIRALRLRARAEDLDHAVALCREEPSCRRTPVVGEIGLDHWLWRTELAASLVDRGRLRPDGDADLGEAWLLVDGVTAGLAVAPESPARQACAIVEASVLVARAHLSPVAADRERLAGAALALLPTATLYPPQPGLVRADALLALERYAEAERQARALVAAAPVRDTGAPWLLLARAQAHRDRSVARRWAEHALQARTAMCPPDSCRVREAQDLLAALR